MKNILFDLDGTLTDPGVGITRAVAYALASFDIHVDDLTTLYPFIGPPLTDSFETYFGFSHERALEAVEQYRIYFADRGLFENKPYDGIAALLGRLRAAGKNLYVATSKPEEFSIKILEHFSLLPYFLGVAGSTMDGSRVKKGDVIAYCLSHYRLDAAQTVMVGDRLHDIVGAHENALQAVGVLYGYGSREELEDCGAERIVADLKELETILLKEECK